MVWWLITWPHLTATDLAVNCTADLTAKDAKLHYTGEREVRKVKGNAF